MPSLHSRERGLKYEQFRKGAAACFVAPLAGAWIEITSSMALFGTPQSLPSRERGLKLEEATTITGNLESLTTRERGLKFEHLE